MAHQATFAYAAGTGGDALSAALGYSTAWCFQVPADPRRAKHPDLAFRALDIELATAQAPIIQQREVARITA